MTWNQEVRVAKPGHGVCVLFIGVMGLDGALSREMRGGR